MHRDYYTRGANHNVPLINGEGEDLGAFSERREWVVEQGDPQSPLRGKLLAYSESPARASRTLEIKGDTLVDTATVESFAKDPQTPGLALHMQGKMKLPETFVPEKDFARGRPDPFARWREVKGATFHDRAEFDVEYAKGVVLHVTLTAPGDFKLRHGSTPDAPPNRRESFYLEFAAPAKSATFTTTFAPATK